MRTSSFSCGVDASLPVDAVSGSPASSHGLFIVSPSREAQGQKRGRLRHLAGGVAALTCN